MDQAAGITCRPFTYVYFSVQETQAKLLRRQCSEICKHLNRPWFCWNLSVGKRELCDKQRGLQLRFPFQTLCKDHAWQVVPVHLLISCDGLVIFTECPLGQIVPWRSATDMARRGRLPVIITKLLLNLKTFLISLSTKM